jgi:hypothetical protein
MARPDFYYRSGNFYSNMLLNDAYLNASIPVTSGLHRRFKASDFNPITKVWQDSALGQNITASGNVTLVSHNGDRQYRITNAVEFDATSNVNFGNTNQMPNYTLFSITRHLPTERKRIIQGISVNWLTGNYNSIATGVAYHFNTWITPTTDLFGTNFFIGTDTSTTYYTNGVLRGGGSPSDTYLPTLGINQASSAGFGESGNGQFLELLIYDRVLSDLEKKKVEHYLASYYGILDTIGNLTASYYRSPLATETSLLVSTRTNPNWITYPSFTISQTGLTFSMWFKSSDPVGFTGYTTWTRLFDFGTGLGASQTYGIMACILSNNLSLTVTSTSNVVCQLGNVYSNCNDNVWRHLVWTISSDGLTWCIYINKVLQATITNANKATYSPTGVNTTGPYHPTSVLRDANWIGKSTWSSDPFLNGSIDEFKMFNTTLDQTEINTLYTVNTVTTLSVNLDQGSLMVPIAGTSFISSNPVVATVSGTTITLISSGSTTITSNLHSTANPIQLVLTVTRKGTGFISGTTDLIETIDKTSIQSLTIRPTTSCQTLSISSKNIYSKNLQVGLDGVSNTGHTTLTFGKTKPNLWVAIGSGTNTLAYSNDGLQWTGVSSSIFVQGRGLAYNGRIWVAGGDGGGTNTLGYSYDGIQWTGLGKSIFNSGCYDFAWNGKLWVAGGGNSGTHTLAYSYDGINWTGVGNLINTWTNSVAWNGKMFVAVGNGTVNMLYSYDGQNWTTNHSSLFIQGVCVRWNGTMWIVGAGINTSSAYIAYSYDGLNWTAVTNSKTLINHENGLIGVAWNGTLWVGTCGGSGCTNSLIYSYDGIIWNGLGASIFTNYPYSITWNGEMFMACGNAFNGTNSMAYSYDGLHWTGLGTSLFSIICYAAVNNVAYENQIIIKPRLSIAGGRGTNTLAYSYDGVTWKGLGNTIFNGGCYSIVWNGSLWVALGYGNTIFAYSYNGIKWSANTSYNALFTFGNWVAWNGTMWIAGGGAGTCTLAYSYDGKTWSAIEKTTFTEFCIGIVSNGKRWVAVGKGNNSIAYSDNGNAWTGLGTSIFSEGLAVAWNGKMFLAGGLGTNNMAYSYDGLIWIGLGTSVPTCHGIGWNEKMWVVVGNGIGYSYDGKTWIQISASFGYGMYVNWNGSLWIAVGLGSTGGSLATSIPGTSTLVYSVDGIIWTPLGKNVIDTDGVGIGSDLLSDNVSVELSRVHVACGSGTNTLAYSYDGIQWIGLGTSIFSDVGGSVAWNGKLWVAGGSGSIHTMGYSYNGIQWTGLGTSIFPVACVTIATNGKIWIAGGYVGASNTGAHSLAYSYDGINWTGNGKTTFIYACSCLAWNGTLWVAVGWASGNQIAYSYDGITWVKCENTPFNGACDSVVWSGTKFVASGIGGIVMYSADGITWTYSTSITQRGQWIAYNGSIFIIVGGYSKVFHSSDGITWTEKANTLTSGTARGIVWTGKMWLIFAESTSNIPYSYDGITWYNNTSLFTTTIGGTVGTNGIQGYSQSANSIQLYQPHLAFGTGDNTMAYSNDGITWTGLGKTMFDTWGSNAVYNGTLWVACGNGTVNSMAYSYDGLNWTGLGNRIIGLCEGLLYYNNVWVGGGFGANTMAYSYDGLIWTGLGNTLFTSGCLTFANNGTLWLAGGYGTNTMAYSYDGLNWTGNPNTPFGEVCYGIAWNGSIWVAVGNGGPVYSYDGITWARATSDITRGRAVVWNGTVFGIIGDPSNLIAYSIDGIFWTSVTYTTFPGVPRGLLWTGDKWIIFAEQTPTMKYSFDGKTWIDTTSTVFINGLSGAVADGRLSDTLNIATDTYYQSGYKSITVSTNQTA